MDPKTDPVTSGPRGPLVTTWGRDDAFWGSARRNARSPGEDYRRGSRKEPIPERILEGLRLRISHAVCPEGRRTASRIPPGRHVEINFKTSHNPTNITQGTLQNRSQRRPGPLENESEDHQNHEQYLHTRTFHSRSLLGTDMGALEVAQ